MPKVSVIIPNYNHAKYLVKRLDSIITQTFTDFEIIILDDYSGDESKSIIERYRANPKVSRIIYNDKNSGSPFIQWEQGLSHAKGEWLWIAESDDFADPLFLATLVKLANDNDNVGIAFCGSYWIDAHDVPGIDLSLYYDSFFRTGDMEIKKRLCKQCSIQNASSAIIRKDLAAAAIKGLSIYHSCGDWLFYLRILHSANIVFTNEKLNYFRWYHDNISNTAKANGYWISEGISVLDEIDYKKIKFNFVDFSKMIKWWVKLVLDSNVKNKSRYIMVIAKTILRNFSSSYI